MTSFFNKPDTASVLGMQTELYKFITTTLIVVDVCLVITLTCTSVHPLITFVLYISFPALAIVSMKMMEKINKPYPFIVFCSICPLLLGLLCYYSGLPSPGWLTAFPLITITLLLINSRSIKLIFLLCYITGLVTACLLIKMKPEEIFYIVMALGIYSAVLERCINYFQLQQLRIEEQKKFIEEKNKEVMDSIRYARRIQTSLLPTDKYIDRILTQTNKAD